VYSDDSPVRRGEIETWTSMWLSIDGCMLAQGQTQGSTPILHQQALTSGPFGNTYEADAVSPKVAMWELQDRDVYNQREYQVDLIQEQYRIYISLTSSDLLRKTIYQI
jgi:hypothetical protein